MQPILTYVGGKYKEINYFQKYFLQNFEQYYEPFLGVEQSTSTYNL